MMLATTPQGLRRLRSFGLVGTAALVLSLSAVAPAIASPTTDECVEDIVSTVCLPGGEALTLGASAADLPGVDEIRSSPNLKLIANKPKAGSSATGTNSDIAFQGKYAFSGNYNGFTIYDISNPRDPVEVSIVSCPGSQNDVSVYGDLLFLSTDSPRSDDSCASTGSSATVKESWEGMKIFDISDKRNPRYIKSVETKCGSHTHTLVPGSRGNVYIYVSSYSPSDTFPDCQPPHDLISIIKVPTRTPDQAALISTPVLFPDGGNPTGNYSRTTSGCHDLTAYPLKKLMAGACMGDGILVDIADPENPRVINRVRDTVNFAFWHSATFNQTGTKVVFTDELGGGTGAHCTEADGPTKGANGIYDIVGRGDSRQLVFKSYYKIPRINGPTENCVAHNGSIVPVIFGDIMVQAWYQGGISVFDFTNSSNPREIAWFERGPLSDTSLVTGGAWSSYWYNGYIYSNDIAKGLDVLQMNDWRVLTAKFNRVHELNVQTQPSYWGW
ncbi:LVIVD repeat-containing protein [Virgisporangium ochraceum]